MIFILAIHVARKVYSSSTLAKHQIGHRRVPKVILSAPHSNLDLILFLFDRGSLASEEKSPLVILESFFRLYSTLDSFARCWRKFEKTPQTENHD
jgi:hypothetical protein